MLTLVRKHVSINSILFDNSKHYYKNFKSSLKILIGSRTDLNVNSSSCSNSNQKYWLRLLLWPKMQTPAGVDSGTPAPCSFLLQEQNQIFIFHIFYSVSTQNFGITVVRYATT